jgi:hypothetical protein
MEGFNIVADIYILKTPKAEFLGTRSCQMTSSALSCFISCLNSKLRLFQGRRVLLGRSVSPLLQAVNLDSGSLQLLLGSVPETQNAACQHTVSCLKANYSS